MFKMATAAAAVVLGTGAAQAAVFDFEGFANGEAINSVTSGTITATVTTDSNGAVDQAIAFDTSLDNTRDPDLEAPFTGSGATNPGKVLIIAENTTVPDDERLGGSVTFSFDKFVDLMSFEGFDGADYRVSAQRGNEFLTRDLIVTGDNLSNSITLPEFNGVRVVTFEFLDFGEGASGAIDNIMFSPAVAPIPVPAALPLLAAGLGGLAFVGRRRRRAQA